MNLSLLLIALASAISYAAGNISARLGLKYSTPITMTCISFVIQSLVLWVTVFFTGGIPDVSSLPLILFVIVGLFMPIIRLLSYIGIVKIGSARSASLRSSYPLFSAVFAVTILNEEASRAVIIGTILVVVGVSFISWQPKDGLSPFHRWHVLFPLTAAFLAGVPLLPCGYCLEQ